MGNKGGPGMGNAEQHGAHQMMTLVKQLAASAKKRQKLKRYY
jgi:hypothetical protein